MPTLAIALYVLYLAIAFGWRTWLQIRQTGSSGFRGIGGTPRTAEWWGGVLFVLALVCGVAAPILQATDTLNPVGVLDAGVVQVLGAAAAVVGIAMTVRAQIDMGVSWRIGVDQDEQIALVTGGLFAHMRNPIFTAMTLAALGLALLTPNAVALLGVIGLVVAIELQVRYAEEPYLQPRTPTTSPPTPRRSDGSCPASDASPAPRPRRPCRTEPRCGRAPSSPPKKPHRQGAWMTCLGTVHAGVLTSE